MTTGISASEYTLATEYTTYSGVTLDPWKTVSLTWNGPRRDMTLQTLEIDYVDRFGIPNTRLCTQIPLYSRGVDIDLLLQTSASGGLQYLPQFLAEFKASRAWGPWLGWSAIRYSKWSEFDAIETTIGLDTYFSDRSNVGIRLGFSALPGQEKVLSYLGRVRIAVFPFLDIQAGTGEYIEQNMTTLDHVHDTFVGVLFPIENINPTLTWTQQNRSASASRSSIAIGLS